MKVRVIADYYDLELDSKQKVGTELDVRKERAELLIANKVAEEIKENNMKVRVIADYYDLELDSKQKVGTELDVRKERAELLIANKVAEEIKEKPKKSLEK